MVKSADSNMLIRKRSPKRRKQTKIRAPQSMGEKYSASLVKAAIGSRPGETAMSVEERDRHEALVERCCTETPKGES